MVPDRRQDPRPYGVHVGLVLPGFVATEGFPATELRQRALTRWIVSKPERVAEAVVRILAPGLVRRVLAGGLAADLTTTTAAEARD